jgi:hypothetical protein
MRSAKEHQLLKWIEVYEAEQGVHDLLVYFIFSLFNLSQKALHWETLDSLGQFLMCKKIIYYS